MQVNIKMGNEAVECDIHLLSYGEGGATALLLMSVDEPGIAYCRASVNLPEIDTPPNHMWIKTWAENEGVLEALIESGAVHPTGVRHEVNDFGSVAELVQLSDQIKPKE